MAEGRVTCGGSRVCARGVLGLFSGSVIRSRQSSVLPGHRGGNQREDGQVPEPGKTGILGVTERRAPGVGVANGFGAHCPAGPWSSPAGAWGGLSPGVRWAFCAERRRRGLWQLTVRGPFFGIILGAGEILRKG